MQQSVVRLFEWSHVSGCMLFQTFIIFVTIEECLGLYFASLSTERMRPDEHSLTVIAYANS
jgi:hypothetical protein